MAVASSRRRTARSHPVGTTGTPRAGHAARSTHRRRRAARRWLSGSRRRQAEHPDKYEAQPALAADTAAAVSCTLRAGRIPCGATGRSLSCASFRARPGHRCVCSPLRRRCREQTRKTTSPPLLDKRADRPRRVVDGVEHRDERGVEGGLTRPFSLQRHDAADDGVCFLPESPENFKAPTSRQARSARCR